MHWLYLISKLSDLFLLINNILTLNQTRHSQVWFCWPPVLSLNTTLLNSTGKMGLLYCTNDVIHFSDRQALSSLLNKIQHSWISSQLNIYLTLQNPAAWARDHALAVRINPMNRLYFPAESWSEMCLRMLSVESFVNWTLQFAALQRNTQIRIQIYKILNGGK